MPSRFGICPAVLFYRTLMRLATAVIRRVLAALVGVALLAAPAAAGPAGHRSDHCDGHSSGTGHHQAPSGPSCQHGDACGDCTVPDCHTDSHCGVSAAGIPVSGNRPAVLAMRPALPSIPAPPLRSITASPPTQPPRLA